MMTSRRSVGARCKMFAAIGVATNLCLMAEGAETVAPASDRSEMHTDKVVSIEFSPDGQTLASGSWDGTIRLWDVRSGSLKKVLAHRQNDLPVAFRRENVLTVAFLPDGKTLASGGWDAKVRLWDISSGRIVGTLADFKDYVYSVTVTENGKRLAAASAQSIKLWDISTRAVERVFLGHDNLVFCVAFIDDDKTLVSGSADGTLRFWEVATGKQKKKWVAHQHYVTWLTVSLDSRLVASSSFDSTVKLWDASTGKVKKVLKGHVGDVLAVEFSPDGKMLVSAGKSVKLWNSQTGKLIHSIPSKSGTVLCVAFSPDGKTLAYAESDHRIRYLALKGTSRSRGR